MRSAVVRTDRYTRVAIWLHWTIALLIIGNLALGLLHESLFDGIGWVIPIHKSIGFTVLALTLGRIAWRLAHRPPPHAPPLGLWEGRAAGAVHFLLYALMLALPLTGWMMVSRPLRRRPLDYFGLFDMPYLPVGQAAGTIARNAHGLLGWTMLALIALHVAAALRHHFLLRDKVLARMGLGGTYSSKRG